MRVLALLLALSYVQAAQQHASISANPIRKVVNMLQMMQKKVAAEGEKEKDLFEKFMCYCKTSGGDLGKSIAAAEDKIPKLGAAIKEAEAKHAQLIADIKKAKEDRAAAKKSMSEASAIREKEAAAFAAQKAEDDTNIAALEKAIPAIEKGMGASFLQTGTAQVLRKLMIDQDMADSDRQEVMAFLSNTQSSEYAPASGEIVGILKQLHETMVKDLKEETAAEDAAIKSFKEMIASKEKEVGALGKSIEDKTVRVGEGGVEIVNMKEDLDDTQKALAEDKKFLEDLEKNCKTKEAEWDVVCKTRAGEQLALADTIKLLNDDDALELFKKTLPGAGASFIQLQVTNEAMRKRALAEVKGKKGLELISLALEGKKIGFEKVIKMIDEMVALLKKEQADDDDKKAYCNSELDRTDDERKVLERSISDLEGAMDDAKNSIAQLTSDIKALEEGIVALDKAVAEATSIRQKENAEYKDLMASDGAAKELIGLAKNRMNKFYNPKLYKAPPKRVLSEDDRIVHSLGGELEATNPPGGIAGTGIEALAQVNAHDQNKVAPPPPPETFGPYVKKNQESNGVIAMMDLLIADLDKEMQEGSVAEKNAQADYEQYMRDSAEKRVDDSKSIEEKTGAKADTEANLQKYTAEKAATTKELMATLKVIEALHAECDWLTQNFDYRKEARTGEIDSLVKAKAILSGADFSLLQAGRSLRRRM